MTVGVRVRLDACDCVMQRQRLLSASKNCNDFILVELLCSEAKRDRESCVDCGV